MKKQFVITKSIEILAKPENIFEVLIDVSNWHTWTSSVNKIIFINKKYRNYLYSKNSNYQLSEFSLSRI